MARKYTRDNRGRFASGGSGATARGGRLKTASGNKRKTQTMKAAGAGGAGVMKGKVQRTSSQRQTRPKLEVRAARSAAPRTPTPAMRDKTRKVTYKAMGMVDNSHTDNALMRSIDRFAKGSATKAKAKLDRVNARATARWRAA